MVTYTANTAGYTVIVLATFRGCQVLSFIIIDDESAFECLSYSKIDSSASGT